jgi:hypothetical protein
MRLCGLQTGVADRNDRRFLVASASALRGSPGVVFAGRALLRFLVVTAFPPNRARTRSAISSSSSSPLSFSRSASSRASRCEIRCFSCSINVVILVVSPWSVDRPPFAVLRYSPTNANEAYQKTTRAPKTGCLDEFLTTSDPPTRSAGGHRGMKAFPSSKRTCAGAFAAADVPRR